MKIKTSANKFFEKYDWSLLSNKMHFIISYEKINLFLQIFLFYYTLSQYFKK